MAFGRKSPEEVAALPEEEYAAYVQELIREAERSAEQRVYSTEEVLAHLAEVRRGRARRVGT